MLPEDENTPEKRANKLWAYFDKKDNGEKCQRHSTLHPCNPQRGHDMCLYVSFVT